MGKEIDTKEFIGPPSDGQLVTRAQSGDQEAIADLYKRYSLYPVKFARKLGLDLMRAEDVSGDAWVSLMEKIRKIEKPESFTPFFGTMIRREVSHSRRKEKSRERWGLLFEADRQNSYDGESFRKIEDEDKQKYLKRKLLSAFIQLPQRQRTLIRLRIIEGKNYEEMTRITGIKQGAFGPTIGRGLATLKKILGEDLEELKV